MANSAADLCSPSADSAALQLNRGGHDSAWTAIPQRLGGNAGEVRTRGVGVPSDMDGYLCSGIRSRPMSGSGFLLAIPAIVGAFRDRGGGLYAARRRMRSTGDKGRRGGSSDPSDIICLRAQSSRSTPRSSVPRMLPSHFSLKQPSVLLLSLPSLSSLSSFLS